MARVHTRAAKQLGPALDGDEPPPGFSPRFRVRVLCVTCIRVVRVRWVARAERGNVSALFPIDGGHYGVLMALLCVHDLGIRSDNLLCFQKSRMQRWRSAKGGHRNTLHKF
jgi:hypothetical protein